MPTRSRAASTPSGYNSRTADATSPVSSSGWSTPCSLSAARRSGRRVVASTVAPRQRASAAAARPTEEVPPRISTDCPGCRSRPTVSEPYAVCTISGSAPSTSQGSSVSTGITCASGTDVYSAYPPSYVRPMSPIIATTFCPRTSPLPSGAASTVPAASIPGTRGKLTPSLTPSRSFNSDRLTPNASTRIRTHPSRSGGRGRVISRRFSTGPGADSWTARMVIGEEVMGRAFFPGGGDPVGPAQHARPAASFPTRPGITAVGVGAGQEPSPGTGDRHRRRRARAGAPVLDRPRADPPAAPGPP